MEEQKRVQKRGEQTSGFWWEKTSRRTNRKERGRERHRERKNVGGDEDGEEGGKADREGERERKAGGWSGIARVEERTR